MFGSRTKQRFDKDLVTVLVVQEGARESDKEAALTLMGYLSTKFEEIEARLDKLEEA